MVVALQTCNSDFLAIRKVCRRYLVPAYISIIRQKEMQASSQRIRNSCFGCNYAATAPLLSRKKYDFGQGAIGQDAVRLKVGLTNQLRWYVIDSKMRKDKPGDYRTSFFPRNALRYKSIIFLKGIPVVLTGKGHECVRDFHQLSTRGQ
jgi:hypothetical protein